MAGGWWCGEGREERAGGSGGSGGWLGRSFVCRFNWPGYKGAAGGGAARCFSPPRPAPAPGPAPAAAAVPGREPAPAARPGPSRAPGCPRAGATVRSLARRGAGGLPLYRAPEPGLIFNPALFGQRPIFLPGRNAIEMRLTFRVISQTGTRELERCLPGPLLT